MEKRRKPFPPNNKLVQEPEGNEENRYPDPDSNKTKKEKRCKQKECIIYSTK
jgi:hypothetical protein